VNRLIVEKTMLKQVLLGLSLIAFGITGAVGADTAAPAKSGNYVVGEDYDVITPPVRAVDSKKIEVAEFFWYGCPHCFHFEPIMEPWKKTLPADVTFRAVPAVWQDRMALHAKAYYTAEALGVLDTMHSVLFNAMNVEHKPLATQQEIADVFTAHGVSAEKFNQTFESFGVRMQVDQAVALAKAAHLSGTPSLMVAGKYQVSGRKAGTQADMLKVVDYLVAQERKAAPATAPTPTPTPVPAK
jgi:thiol:disulfide interchange protein DsbA